MIILSDSNNNVVGSFLDGTIMTDLSGVTDLPTHEQQVGKNAILVIDPTTKVLSYNYVDRPLTDSEKLTQSDQQIAAMLLAMVEGGLM